MIIWVKAKTINEKPFVKLKFVYAFYLRLFIVLFIKYFTRWSGHWITEKNHYL